MISKKRKRVGDLSDLDFAAFILEQRLHKIANPNDKMAVKLRSAISTLKGMQRSIRTVVITNNDPDCDTWVTPFSSYERAEEFARKAKEKIEELDAPGVRVYTDSMILDSDDYLGWLEDVYKREEE